MKNSIIYIFILGFVCSAYSQEIIPIIDGNCSDPQSITYYIDIDNDDYGDPSNFIELDVCEIKDRYGIYVSNNRDCDDDNPNITFKKRWYLDNDKDGKGSNNTATSKFVCTNPSTATIKYVLNNDDCNDNDINIIGKTAYYIDRDKDGKALANATARYECTNPSTSTLAYVTAAHLTDCDDTNPNIQEKTWYIDSDGDGFGESTTMRVRCNKPSGNFVENNLDLCPGIKGSNKGCPPANTDVAELWNTVQVTNYDTKGKVVSKSKSYYDDLGKSVQTQSKDLKTNKIWASQTLYDTQGRPALQTLSAPTNQDIPTEFLYRTDFIKKSNGNTFTTSDFENNLEDPSPTGQQPNSLGWYYSKSNTDELYQDITQMPYSRTIYSELNPGTVLKTIGGNKMDGQWKNGYVFSMPVGQELTQNLAFGDTKYNGNTYKIIKTVSRDVHGIESVIFTDTDGRTLAAARSGNEEGNKTSRSSNVHIKKQGFVDIHIPVGITGFQISGSTGIEIDCYDLTTEQLVTTPENEIPAGLYRVVVKDISTYTYNPNKPIIVTYKENYYDYSLNEYDKAGRLLSSYQPLNKLKSEFKYNSLGQLEYTKSPDEGEAWFKYRKDGQIRYSQNGKQVAAGEFSYTNYDHRERPVESGVLVNTAFATTNPDAVLPTGNRKEQHHTVYDRNDNTGLAAAFGSDTRKGKYSKQNYIAGNVSKTYTTSPETTTTWYSYDIYGRVQWIAQQISGLPGVKTIDYVYDPISSQVTQVFYQKEHPTEQFIHKYAYDADDYSLTKVETSVDGSTYTENAQYSYYETGALKRINLANKLQGIDYVYNLNGALKGINHPNLVGSDPGRDGNDLFGMTINYYNKDYSRDNTPTYVPTLPDGIDQYNGNIKSVIWSNRGETSKDRYYYKYNRNNWLQGASYNKTIKQSVTSDGDYNVYGITYDANGNIQSLNRNKQTENGSNAMDQLAYAYKTDKPNQLLRVDDAVITNTNADDIKDQNGDNYEYNSIGQLTKNNEENIAYLYNTSGLVTEVKKDNKPLVKFFYNDKNHRVRKESYNPSNGNIIYREYYVRDAAGTAMAIYRDGQVVENTIYGASRLGVRKSNGTHLYQLTDHLGNVRAVVGRTPKGQAMALTSATDYYPFGMPMPNRTLNGAEGYRYAYQGQEKDPETGKEAFQLRLWDGRIGRWLTTDPAKQYSSPYLGMGNNPINGIDPDGAKFLWKPDKNGNLIAEAGDNANTLATYLNISVTEATSMIESQNLLPGNYFQTNSPVAPGEVLKLDNVFTRALSNSNGLLTSFVNADNTITKGEKLKMFDRQNDDFNCFGCSINGVYGQEITSGSTIGPISMMRELGSMNRVNPDQAVFGQTILTFGSDTNPLTHAAVYYGSSNDGTVYVFTKNGRFVAPEIMSLNTLIDITNRSLNIENHYGTVNGYFNPN